MARACTPRARGSGEAVALYETLQEMAGRIISYAELTRAGNVADPEIARFFQTTHERINAISTELLFFTLELNRIDDAVLDGGIDPFIEEYLQQTAGDGLKGSRAGVEGSA